MTTSLSNLVDNFAQGIHKIKCKNFDCFHEFESVKDSLIEYKCLPSNKDYSNKLDEKVKKRFKNTFKFSNNDINKFILLLRKGVYPYKYMDDWEKFNETTLLEKEEFYSNLNKEDITDADYMYEKRVYKDFEIKSLGQYHDLYLKSDTLLLADVFENFKKCVQLSIRSCKISFSSWISMVKELLELLTDIGMLLMVEKGIGGGICNTIHQYAKAINKYMKDYDKNKESSYLKY